jgi:hypothetical protein
MVTELKAKERRNLRSEKSEELDAVHIAYISQYIHIVEMGVPW